MTRREQCEAIIKGVDSAGLPGGPIIDELRALWAVVDAARQHTTSVGTPAGCSCDFCVALRAYHDGQDGER